MSDERGVAGTHPTSTQSPPENDMSYQEAHDIMKNDLETGDFNYGPEGDKLRQAQQIAVKLLEEAAEQQ